MKKHVLFFLLITCSIGSVISQNVWQLGGNNISNNLKEGIFGTKNAKDLEIITNNQKRMHITSDGYTVFYDTVRILGPLCIGDSTLMLENNVLFGGLTAERISSNNYAINFMRRIYSPFPIPGSTVYQSNLKIGIGIQEPVHQMHLHHAPALGYPVIEPTVIGFTNNVTGSAVLDGFLVGINTDGTAELRQQEDRAIRIFTNDGANSNQRMIITHNDDVTNLPRVGIGRDNLLTPRTFLQIGQDIAVINTGFRNWMNIGELVVDEKSNNMYFGFSQINHIINWGSESSNQDDNRLRFVNTSGNGLVQSGSQDGLEIARMVSDGTTGRMGIGDFFTIGQDPTQVLDVIGNARLRTLPTQQDETLTRCVVVDDEGVLHWRNFNGSSTGGSLGNICADPISNPLLNNWEIPLNDYNFVFSGQGLGNNRVGIGIANCQPTAKLDVFMIPEEINTITIKGVNEGFLAADGFNIGIYGEASNSHISTGVFGTAVSSTSSKNNGGYFTAYNATYNYGGYFKAVTSNPNTINNYGVYAVCPPIVTGAAGNWAGYFDGHVHVVGNITYTGTCTNPSDQQFKQNINDYTGAIDIIRELRPVTFLYDTANYDLNFPANIQYGLIAQEVEPFLPELISDQIIPAKFDSVGNIVSESIPYKGLNYQQLTPIILQAVKELDETMTSFIQSTEDPQLKVTVDDLQYINDSLIQRVNALEARLENIEQMLFNNGDNQINNSLQASFHQEVTLENTKSIVLNQNVPNPFKEQTTISFQIPESVNEAKIVFIDNLGNILKQVDISDRGFGELIVYAHDLSAGHYTYYLVADGITIESKKMVLTK